MQTTRLYKRTDKGIREWTLRLDNNKLHIQYGLLDSHNNQYDLIEHTTPEGAEKDAIRRINHKTDREGFSHRITDDPPKMPMLAVEYTKYAPSLPWDIMIQPKYDGIRCVASNTSMLSRRNEKICSLPHIRNALNALPDGVYLDGELYIHGEDFNTQLSHIKRDNPHRNCARVKFYVFDIQMDTEAFIRYHIAENYVESLDHPNIVLCPSKIIPKSSITHTMEEYLEAGFEGVMLKDPRGKYEYDKRSHAIQKYKPHFDNEYPVIDWTTSKSGREAGRAIAICRTKEGKTFQCRLALSHALACNIYTNKQHYNNCHLRVKHYGINRSGIPRQPIGESLIHGKSTT